MHRSDHRDTDAHVLAGRLTTGWLVIDAERDPARKQRLEDHWIHLLHDYETACDGAHPRPEQKPDDRFSRNGELTR